MGSVEGEKSHSIDPIICADNGGEPCLKSLNHDFDHSLQEDGKGADSGSDDSADVTEEVEDGVEHNDVRRVFRWCSTDEDLCEEMKTKAGDIHEVLSADHVNVGMLRNLAVRRGGLITDDIRRKVWPKLLNISVDNVVLQNDNLYDHPEYNQVVMDVRRAGGRFPPGLTDKEDELLQKQLIDLIMRILVKHPELHYYQGYHDICITILLAVGEEIAFVVVDKLSTNHLRDFLDVNMDKTRHMLNYLLPVILRVDRKLGEFMERSEVGTIFALSWLITWYGHVLKDYKSIVRLYDFFLACHPLMPVYLAAALVLHRSKEVTMEDCEMTSVHSLLSKIPDDLQFEDLISKAGEVFLNCPPSTLAKQVRTQLRKQQLHLENARKQTSRKYGQLDKKPSGKSSIVFDETNLKFIAMTALGMTASAAILAVINILSEYYY